MGAKQGTTIREYGSDYGTGTAAKGSSDKITLKALYGTSPVINQSVEQLTENGGLDSGLRTWYTANVLHATQNANTMMGTVDMTFAALASTTGDVSAATTGGGGWPSTPYVPNPASPGEGNGADPTGIPETDYSPPSSGMGSTEGPQDTSATQGSFSLTNMPTAGNSPS